jgi:ERCC4-type nuclease
MNYILVADDRESRVIPHLHKYDKKKIPDGSILIIKTDRLTVGDYAILDSRENILFVIERKSWKDLSASIRDGRKKNINKLKEVRSEYPWVQIFYLIEGKSRYKSDHKVSRIPFANLESHLDHIAVRDNIKIIFSRHPEDSAERLYRFIVNYTTLDIQDKIIPVPDLGSSVGSDSNPSQLSTIESESVGGVDRSINRLKKKFIKNDQDIIKSIWACVPYITDKSSAIFIKKDIHISDFLLSKIKKEEIQTFKINQKTLGKRSEKICKIQNLNWKSNQKYYIKMISQIPGITCETSKIILQNYGMEDILKKKITIKDIAEIQKTPLRRIGKKCAELVIKYFTKI